MASRENKTLLTQKCSQLHHKKLGQQVKGGDSAPILCPCERPPEALCANMGSSAKERLGFVRASPIEGHSNDQRAGTPIL